VSLLDRVKTLLGETGAPRAAGREPGASAGVTRRSNGLKEFTSEWRREAGLCILDLGQTSSANLTFITNLGHRIYTEDLISESADPKYMVPGEAGPHFDAERFLAENLKYPPQFFDSVLLWDLPDYLPEELVRPLTEHLSVTLKPGGTVLAYFHTKAAGANAPFFRYHIRDSETIELRPAKPHQPLRRVYNNRHIENLFKQFRCKFFLARDNLYEVVITRQRD
jgi:hypothetical protein